MRTSLAIVCEEGGKVGRGGQDGWWLEMSYFQKRLVCSAGAGAEKAVQ